MGNYRETKYRRSVRDAGGVISQNLDTVESGVDVAIDSAKDVVHELRGKAEEIADETLSQVKNSWDQKQTRIERYLNTHPWVVFGILLLFAYFFSGERTGQSGTYQSK